MTKKEMTTVLLADGQGSHLGILTQKVAEPAASFGGKYRIIDFSLSNCINSGVDAVGVLTQYQPLCLNSHIEIGILWDLDRNVSGVTVLLPYERSKSSDWYIGTTNAIYWNLEYMKTYNPEYVLISSGDHIYKVNHEAMLDYRKANNADITAAATPISIEEASRLGILITDESNRIMEFEERPLVSRSNLASMGVCTFGRPMPKEALIKVEDELGCNFGKHTILYCHAKGGREFACEYNGYWKDVDTLGPCWEVNMELTDIIPEFNLYKEYWKIYTKGDVIPPQYIPCGANTERGVIDEGTEIYGEVTDPVISADVIIGKGIVVRDPIVIQGSIIEAGSVVDRAVVVENVKIGPDIRLGVGEYVLSTYNPKIYQFDLIIIGENSIVPDGMRVGKNTAIAGDTTVSDYPDGLLVSGSCIIKADGVKWEQSVSY